MNITWRAYEQLISIMNLTSKIYSSSHEMQNEIVRRIPNRIISNCFESFISSDSFTYIITIFVVTINAKVITISHAFKVSQITHTNTNTNTVTYTHLSTRSYKKKLMYTQMSNHKPKLGFPKSPEILRFNKMLNWKFFTKIFFLYLNHLNIWMRVLVDFKSHYEKKYFEKNWIKSYQY